MNPFAKEQAHAIGSLGESEFIRLITSWLGKANPEPPHGIGDDCAVLPLDPHLSQQLVTADPVIYKRHFDDSITPEQVATKLVRRNLSDIAAMGGFPKQAIVSLALDSSVAIDWMERFYRELAREAERYDFRIVGGDVSGADHFLGAFLTLIGDTGVDISPLLRKRATADSYLFATGSLGGSRIHKHHTFEPRLKEGQWLALQTLCSSCTDISDGLGKDFANLIDDQHFCEIDCAMIPLSSDAEKQSQKSGESSLYHAFNDGEDFELLFSLQPNANVPAFMEAWKRQFETQLTLIGRVRAKARPKQSGLVLINAPQEFKASGYEHLK